MHNFMWVGSDWLVSASVKCKTSVSLVRASERRFPSEVVHRIEGRFVAISDRSKFSEYRDEQ